jgi:microcystin-dependent protein
MSFRQFGGLNYAPKNNIVSSNYNASNNLLITKAFGEPNSYITFLSDISGNIVLYGNLETTENLHVIKNVDISENVSIGGTLDVSNDVNLNNNLNVSGNTSFAQLPTCNNTPSESNQLITKAYADATYESSGNVLGSNNIWTGTNTFNNNIIGPTGSFSYLSVSEHITAGGSITGSTGSFNSLNVSGNTSFSQLPTCNNTPSESNQLITKAYADATYESSGNVLGSNNIWTGTNTFSNNTYLATISENKVGIGNTNPSYTLDVSGNGNFTETLYSQYISSSNRSTFQNDLIVQNGANPTRYIRMVTDSNNSYIQAGQNLISNSISPLYFTNMYSSTPNMVIVPNSGGLTANIGINKSNPLYTLDVSGNVAINDGLSVNGTSSTNPLLHVTNTSILGSTDGSNITLSLMNNTTGNNIQLNTYLYRFSSGSDWTTANLRIQNKIDSTYTSYIEFSPSGYLGGIAIKGYSGLTLPNSSTNGGVIVDTNGTVYIGQNTNVNNYFQTYTDSSSNYLYFQKTIGGIYDLGLQIGSETVWNIYGDGSANFTGSLSTSSLNVSGTTNFTSSSPPTSSQTMPPVTDNSTNIPTTKWVQSAISYAITGIPSGSPVGTIIMYSGTSIPSDYLWCDGASYSTTTYSSLYNVIGNTYGSGSGTFNVPNLQTRFPIGSSTTSNISVNYNGVTTGPTGGDNTIGLNQIPNHTHNPTSPGTGFYNATATPQVLQTGGSNGLTIFPTTGTITNYTSQQQFLPPFTVINYIIRYQ